MTEVKIEYRFSSEPWKHAAPGGWVFVSIPKELAIEIRESSKKSEAGWGRLPATARIGNTEWKTAIWFDSKLGTYLLPLKESIRLKERVVVGQKINVALFL